MDPHGSTHRERTVVLLQRTADAGPPVMIPGARDSSTRRATARAADAIPPANPPAATVDVTDRSQLAHEREGGGAPSERSGARQQTLRALLGAWFGRGIDLLRPAAAFTPPGGGS